jgi:hypothetical protein
VAVSQTIGYARVTVVAFATLLVLSGCATGTVQAKRNHCCDRLHMHVYELCIGDSVDSCAWERLTSKTDDLDYKLCDVGEKYPDCRNLFSRQESGSR